MGLLSWWRSTEPMEKMARIEPTFHASVENPAVPINADALATIFTGGPTMAGPAVNESSSIRCVDVFRCVSLTAGIIASLRMNVYRKDVSGRRELSETHRLYPFLRTAPNENMTAYTWRHLMVVNLLLWGNHYSRIQYDGSGRVAGFLPLAPWAVAPELRDDGSLKYRIFSPNGEIVYSSDEIIHVPGLGFDGLKGVSVISAVGRQAIGTSLAMEEFTARLHSNGVRPSGVATVKEGISPAAFSRMKSQFDAMYAGSANAGSTMWLDNGSTWQPMQLSPADAQTIEARRLSTAQICNIFGVPAMFLNENADMTAWGSGIEQIMLGFLMTTVNPWLEAIENELNRKLFMGTSFDVEFDREGLIVLDSKAKAELFSKLVSSALMTPNEGRRKINLPDAENGDKLYIQGAMVPLDMAGTQLTQQHSAPDDAAEKKAEAAASAVMERFNSKIEALSLDVRDIAARGPQPVTVNMPEIKSSPVNVTANIHVPKRGADQTVVTEYDEEGRIKAFERREVEDGKG
jgi:HK97 family phage portal protein